MPGIILPIAQLKNMNMQQLLHTPSRACKRFCLFLLLVALLLPYQLFAKEVYWQKAGSLVNAGDYGRAYDEVKKLLKTRPDDVLLLRIQSVCLMETGYHDAAVMVLLKALEIDPDSVACQYYLGQALAYRGSIREAVIVLAKVISLAPESEYGRFAREILPELEALEDSSQAISDDNRWNVYLRGALSYDDNVVLRPSSSDDNTPTESLFFNYSFYAEIRWPDQKIDNSPLTIGLGYSLSGSEYEDHDFAAYDLFSQDLNLFFSRSGTIFDRFYNGRLDLHASDTRLGWRDYSKISGTKLSFQYNWHEMVASTLFTSWDNREYENDTEWAQYYSLDGDEYDVGLHNYIYLMDNNFIVGLNYSYRVVNAEGYQNELRSNDATLSLTVNLPFELRLYGQESYQQADYPEYYPVGRLDDIWTFYTSLQRSFFSDLLSLELSYTYSTADSDADYARYERNIFSAALSVYY